MARRPNDSVPFSEVFDLPAWVPLRAAACALGISLYSPRNRIRAGSFPCPLHRRGRSYVVELPHLLRQLGIQDVRVHDDDIEAGAAFAAAESDP